MQEISPDILNELKNISPKLAAIEKVNVFHAPDNYFAELEQKLLTTVFLNQDEKNKSQHVPEGYFNSLSERILSKIKMAGTENADEEIKQLSPTLHYLKKEEIFSVPPDYFENLSNNILRKIQSKPAKVFSINGAKKWWKYAAAAVVAGVITITSLQIFNHQTQKEKIAATYIHMSAEYKTPQKLDEGIASLTDDEIAKYLEKTGNILDDETLIKNTNTQELPSATDYLFDENTLNNYLKSINSESINSN